MARRPERGPRGPPAPPAQPALSPLAFFPGSWCSRGLRGQAGAATPGPRGHPPSAMKRRFTPVLASSLARRSVMQFFSCKNWSNLSLMAADMAGPSRRSLGCCRCRVDAEQGWRGGGRGPRRVCASSRHAHPLSPAPLHARPRPAPRPAAPLPGRGEVAPAVNSLKPLRGSKGGEETGILCLLWGLVQNDRKSTSVLVPASN